MPILFDKAVNNDAQIEELLVYLQAAIPATAAIAVNREDGQLLKNGETRFPEPLSKAFINAPLLFPSVFRLNNEQKNINYLYFPFLENSTSLYFSEFYKFNFFKIVL